MDLQLAAACPVAFLASVLEDWHPAAGQVAAAAAESVVAVVVALAEPLAALVVAVAEASAVAEAPEAVAALLAVQPP